MNNEETILISLNSKYAKRYINGSTSNCEFFLPVIEIPSQHYIYLSIANGSIPYSFYNIDDNNNNLVLFSELPTSTGGSYNVSNTFNIRKGNYNSSQLVNYMNQQFSTNTINTDPSYNITFSISYDIITNKVTISSSFNFYFGQESTCLELFGFSKTDIYNSVINSNQVITSTNCVNLLSKSCICIHSNLLTGNISTNPAVFDNTILTQIPVSTPPYSLITFSNQNARSCLYTNTISYINIKLTDQDNKILNLNGCHWSMTLELTVVKFVE